MIRRKLQRDAGADVVGAVLAAPTSHIVTVLDDAPPSLSVNSVAITESTSTGVFTVSLSTRSGKTVHVQYATTDGTAAAGTDYSATSGTAIISPGQLSATVPLPIVNDAVPELPETFTLTLSAPDNATLGTAHGTGTDAELARWVSQDPFGLQGGANLFRYADDIPVRFNDVGVWFPYANDCQQAVDDCLQKLNFKNPGAPGGRWGPACDPCNKK